MESRNGITSPDEEEYIPSLISRPQGKFSKPHPLYLPLRLKQCQNLADLSSLCDFFGNSLGFTFQSRVCFLGGCCEYLCLSCPSQRVTDNFRGRPGRWR